MGFWGTLVVARSATPLPELIADQVQRAEPAGEYADGWQVARIFGDVNPGHLADELQARTGSPVIAGIVFDSDCVDLRINGRTCWTTTLCREAAASYFRTYLHEAKGLHGAELKAETTSMLGESPQDAAE